MIKEKNIPAEIMSNHIKLCTLGLRFYRKLRNFSGFCSVSVNKRTSDSSGLFATFLVKGNWYFFGVAELLLVSYCVVMGYCLSSEFFVLRHLVIVKSATPRN